jgi:hypothetical protein
MRDGLGLLCPFLARGVCARSGCGMRPVQLEYAEYHLCTFRGRLLLPLRHLSQS